MTQDQTQTDCFSEPLRVITGFKTERDKEINIMTNAVAWFLETYDMDPKPSVIETPDATTEMYLAAVTRGYDQLEKYRATRGSSQDGQGVL